MFFRLTAWLAVATILFHHYPVGSSSVGATAGSVVINELMWMGSSASTSDEWIELRNMTDAAVDLTGWRLTKRSNGAEAFMLEIPSGRIEPHGFFLVANYDASHPSSALAAAPDLVDTDVALSNSALQVTLYNQLGQVADVADDGGGNPVSGRYASADGIYWSMERNPVPGDGTVAESWHTASAGSGWRDGRSEYGTPGAPNSNGRPVAAAGADIVGLAGQPVHFDGTDSTDPEQQPLTFAWEFGDGHQSATMTPEHTFVSAGQYTVRLTVSDGLDVAVDELVASIEAAPSPDWLPPDESVPSAGSAPSNSCRGVMLNEVFPNPAGADDGEFIELFNPGSETADLTGCAIWVNEKRKYTLLNETVDPGQYLVVEKSRSRLSLTNDGGAVRLVDTDASELDRLEYPLAPEHESWARFDRGWAWTNRVTPAGNNAEAVDDEKSETEMLKEAVEEIPPLATIADIQTFEAGETVRVQGVVTAAADTLAVRTVWLQDDRAGLQILLPEEALKPSVGDLIEAVGTVRNFQGRKRLSGRANGLRVTASGRPAEPKKITADLLSPEYADMLVVVQGVVASNSGAKIFLDDGSGEVEVYLKSSTGIIKPKISGGDRLAATGIVNVATAGIKILPRIAEDLQVERVLGASTGLEQAPTPLPTAPANQAVRYWGLVGLGLLIAGARPAWRWWRARHQAARATLGE